MRSRFSAFAVRDASYLLATWHSSTRPPSLELDDAVDWLQLEIVSGAAGGESDDRGSVEFVAYFWDTATRERGQQREHSSFVREGGQWFYVGEVASA